MRRTFLTFLFIASFIGPPRAHAQSVPAAPVNRPLPDYPDAANRTEGAVKLHFSIDAEGQTADVTVLESNPPGLFDEAALAAVRQWRYSPRTDGGKPVEQSDNAILLKFKPPTEDPAPQIVRKLVSFFPRQAFNDQIEGDVTVRFDINTIGTVEHAVVLESTPPIVFDHAALESLHTLRFLVRTVDGKPQPVAGVQMTIPFRLKDALLAPHRISSGAPIYPQNALNAGVQGFCTFHFGIQDDGSIKDGEILDTYPRDVFRQTCLNFIPTLKYAPPIDEHGGHVAREQFFHVQFQISTPGYTPKYDLKAGEWVRIQYSVTAEGRIKDAKVVQTSGADVPSGSALEQIKNRRVKPFIENGVAVDKPNQFIVVTGPEE